MPVESGGDLVANALVWPALNRYPTAKQQDAGRQQTGKATRCTVAACNQPDLSWPFTPPFIRPCQVGGTLFVYLPLLYKCERHRSNPKACWKTGVSYVNIMFRIGCKPES